MAYGVEAVLEIPTTALLRLAGVSDEPTDFRSRWQLAEAAADVVNPALRTAHEDLVRARFDASAFRCDATGAADPEGDYVHALTPAGPRTLAPFTLDPRAYGRGLHLVTGIGVWGRHLPIWADWEHEHGGSDVPLRLGAVAPWVEEARTALAAVIAEAQDAELVVIERRY